MEMVWIIETQAICEPNEKQNISWMYLMFKIILCLLKIIHKLSFIP